MTLEVFCRLSLLRGKNFLKSKMNKILIFFDLSKPIELIPDSVKHEQDKIFRTLLKILELSVTYFVVYLIIKFGHFILSLLSDVDMADINLIYFVLPLLFFIEYGLSKAEPKNVKYILLFLIRASVKYLLFYSIELLFKQ
ncbi:hypothetical protein AWN68_10630 [Roseivirga echinicomitans]|uniref:Uncharacterized protein n=1 Tax=Roseivirga echinicomitans TaxID=296218 RepID=A0A150X344_9BACT|nr:hypothetical protein AWN68_10630 [Roseivirga echinicomitans]